MHSRKKVYALKDTLEIPSLWKIFAGTTSLRRYFWILIFITCSILFLYETSDRVRRLIWPSKSATVKLEHEQSLEFPSVTVCPGYQFRASVLRAKLPDDRYGCKPGTKYCTWTSPWNMATHTETMIKHVRYKTEWCTFQKKPCGPGTERVGKWYRRFTSLGRCFTYNANTSVENGGISNALEISVDPMLWDKHGIGTFNGIRVYIHNASEIPLVEITGLSINQASSVQFSLQVKDYTRVNDVQIPCTTDPDYNESRCVLRCIHVTAMRVSNNSCSAPFMQEIKTKAKVCRTRKEIAFFNENFQKVVYNGSIWNRCVHTCPKACVKRVFKPITTSLGFGNANEIVNITIYIGSMWVEKIIENWDYNLEEFIADTGGSLNLFLGASFYSIIQVFDYAAGHMVWYLQKLLRRKNIILGQSIHTSKTSHRPSSNMEIFKIKVHSSEIK